VAFVTDRRLLARAGALAFAEFRVAGPGRPVVGRDGCRTFVWMPLGDPPPQPATRHATASSVRARAPSAGAIMRRAAAASPAAAGWPARLAGWGLRLRRLADLARAQRRREPWT
jgi:hypothetical protein